MCSVGFIGINILHIWTTKVHGRTAPFTAKVSLSLQMVRCSKGPSKVALRLGLVKSDHQATINTQVIGSVVKRLAMERLIIRTVIFIKAKF